MKGNPMNQSLFHLYPDMFSVRERPLLESGNLKASIFRYESGVCALRMSNDRGALIMLPFQGQQIWSANFDGRELTMRSMFDQPRATQIYLETYGGFLLHCGATAMGVPGPQDSHALHGELPNAPYQKAALLLGEDDLGPFIALTGTYQHTVAFNYNYTAIPLVKIHSGSALFSVDITIRNQKNTPMPLMYLAHANFRPVNESRLVYSAQTDPAHVRVRSSIPPHIHPRPEYKDFLAELTRDPSRHHILRTDLAFDPEVVFFIDYLADDQGWAHSLQIHPSGSADYIAHKPQELRKGVRWISRTPDQDALGLILPATAEPEGYLAELAKGNVMQLEAHSGYEIHMRMGALTAAEALAMENKISAIVAERKP
jgi:hypothetical protein